MHFKRFQLISFRAAKILWVVALIVAALPEPVRAASPADAESIKARRHTVLDAIQAEPKLHTFAKALQVSGLADELANARALTIFAPTNAAFDEWPTEALAKLFAHPVALASLVEFHLVDGVFRVADLETMNYVATRLGRLASVMRDDPFILINDARIVGENISADNGVVHLIDTVLEP